MKNPDNGGREILRALTLLSQLGFSMAACILLGILAGRFLDNRLGTAPWLLILGAVIGVLAAFKTMYEMVIKEWMH